MKATTPIVTKNEVTPEVVGPQVGFTAGLRPQETSQGMSTQDRQAYAKYGLNEYQVGKLREHGFPVELLGDKKYPHIVTNGEGTGTDMYLAVLDKKKGELYSNQMSSLPIENHKVTNLSFDSRGYTTIELTEDGTDKKTTYIFSSGKKIEDIDARTKAFFKKQLEKE